MCTTVYIGETLEKWIRVVKGGDGIKEILWGYKDKRVIPIYIVDSRDPILAVDPHGEVLTLQKPMSSICYDDELLLGVEIHTEDVEMNELNTEIHTENVEMNELNTEGVENNELNTEMHVEGGDLNESHNETHGEVPEFNENYNEIHGKWADFAFNDNNNNESDGGDDEEESHSDSSSVSDCPSLMFEDFEGPEDDDIFVKWYSDVEEDDLESMRGSDDEGSPFFVWFDDTGMRTFEMIVGVQFPSKKKYREVLRNWAVRKGWDLKFTCNEAAKITAICQLLTAIGRDGNGNVFPIIMAYVEIEKKETWKWFLNLLLRDIGSADEKGWVFISNRQKGLIEAIHSLAPSSEHSVKQHLRIMKEIERLSPERGNNQIAYEWMCKISSHHWARCFFPNTTKCDVLVNNVSESFNSYILDARELPIIDMFECIRRKCMIRLQVKRAGMEKFKGVICPNIQKKIESQRVVSKNYFPTWAGGDKFEKRHFMENHIVYLNDKHCSCGMYQLVGYPCCHAIASLNYHNLEYDDYVDDYSKKDCYMRVYSQMINHVPCMHDFEESPLGMVDPPNVKVRVGRPRKVRRRDGNDRRDPTCVSRVRLTHTCGICLQQGHNKSTCTNPPHPNSTFKNNNARENENENDVEFEAAQEEQPISHIFL
ncbi:hypothetical protein BUALT_Bualt17G0025400 [Buddleja alternifolia]|uniref:SWIM-type domain-containing protein n=1 Tax=Buddleja alternifolia TaxID=168488 RepID=A0AAV6W3U5_9LAMI|nr:hypothetical protein BUALT_Bualt17G0025400 [Buddleja alternifolia]